MNAFVFGFVTESAPKRSSKWGARSKVDDKHIHWGIFWCRLVEDGSLDFQGIS
jgi:hypothetical protein